MSALFKSSALRPGSALSEQHCEAVLTELIQLVRADGDEAASNIKGRNGTYQIANLQPISLD
ncbi:hypothetical protein Rhsp01_49170 [Rhizobium sp. NBRC 114257]|uniref:Uncharacterized protein n=1 Tax=Rhizobium dioscoreae TaxID=2653122 RepID=A0ABQ0ZAS3_9HYPH|nr:hypothetical protein RsS93_50300 [Rhizobium dioscoreae]GLU83741.1 hypothetical protein Rhsp01_49170 [Rhizobium sp. NBRC 114257]